MGEAEATARARAETPRRIRLQVVSEIAGAAQARLSDGAESTPFVQGTAEPEFHAECGRCGHSLTEGVSIDQLRPLTIRCPVCGTLNRYAD